MSLRIVLLGGPGAGKGTQAKRMCEAYDLPHISTGDIFRAHLKEGTDIGKQVQSYLDAGQLVPDELTCQIVAGRLTEADCAAGYVLDGFPRSVPQAEKLQEILDEHGEALDVAINIDVTDDEIVDRLTARWTCPTCGRIYNLKFEPPKQEGVCDNAECGGVALTQRKDDQEETIRERLRVYHETTEPIISFYDKLGVLKTIESTGVTPDEVFAQVQAIVQGVQKA